MRVAQLRELCKNRGVSSFGTKPVLMASLLGENGWEEEVEGRDYSKVMKGEKEKKRKEKEKCRALFSFWFNFISSRHKNTHI